MKAAYNASMAKRKETPSVDARPQYAARARGQGNGVDKVREAQRLTNWP